MKLDKVYIMASVTRSFGQWLEFIKTHRYHGDVYPFIKGQSANIFLRK